MTPIVLQARVVRTSNDKWKHLFKCGYCSTEFVAIGADVTSGRTKSCGCHNKAVAKARFLRHGKTKTVEHRAWQEMKRRCYHTGRPGYQNYGGRGIKVCDSWVNSFENFLRDMGPKPHASYSLDRIDNDKDYCPDNCRWADRQTQSRNQRRHKGKVWK